MTTPQDPYSNPPGWTDPYKDLSNISGDDPLPPMEPPTTPPAGVVRGAKVNGYLPGTLAQLSSRAATAAAVVALRQRPGYLARLREASQDDGFR